MLVLGTSHLADEIFEIEYWSDRSALVPGLTERLRVNATFQCGNLYPEKSEWLRDDDGGSSLRVRCGGQDYGAYQSQSLWQEFLMRDTLPSVERFAISLEAIHHFITAIEFENAEKAVRLVLSAVFPRRSGYLRLRLAFICRGHGLDEIFSDIQAVERFPAPGAWAPSDDALTIYNGIDETIRLHVMGGEKRNNHQQLAGESFVARYVHRVCRGSVAAN